VDSSEVLSFKEHLEEFTENHCEVVGVTSDSPLAVKRWISKDVSCGGFGGPVDFFIMTDKDLSLSMSMGVAMDCRAPSRATFIIVWTGTVRYMMVHRSDIGRSVKEILGLQMMLPRQLRLKHHLKMNQLLQNPMKSLTPSLK
jgi:alkyl hydroperoxide reductase subunit AhpC